MRNDSIRAVFVGSAGVLGAVVFFAELSYWLAHLRRPGPAMYIALSGLAIVLLSIGVLIKKKE